MTLFRLAAGLAVTAAVFVGWEFAAGRRDRRTAAVATVEAAVLALFAGLFFGSFGNGGWPLVFLLLGLLASGRERWLGPSFLSVPGKARIITTVLVVIRYVVAGGVLALLAR